MKHFATESDRLEAFSDGVIAVIITIMVLELHPPDSANLKALVDVWPTFAAYLLSFVFVGIYWNNHHHMLRATRGIDGRAMWANLHLLFWLSLVPFTTAWLGRYPHDLGPTLAYGGVLLLCAVAYTLLELALLHVNGRESPFARALSSGTKGLFSLGFYASALAFAFLSTAISDVIFVIVAVLWFIPDRRFESLIGR